MLIEFRVSNFRSFKEEQTLSMVAAKDKNHPGGVTDCGKFKLLNAAAIYGANASGKSNLVTAMRFVNWFVNKSAKGLGPQEQIPMVDPFRLDSKNAKEPSSFQVTIRLGDTDYEYGFSVDSERVWAEWLYVCPPFPKRRQRWLKRTYEPRTGEYSWVIRQQLEDERASLWRSTTRENCLALSQGANLNSAPLLALFQGLNTALPVHDATQDPQMLRLRTAHRAAREKDFADLLGRMLRQADFGIEGIRIAQEPPIRLAGFVTEKSKQLVDQILDQIGAVSDRPRLAAKTVHTVSDTRERVEFDLESEESGGTQRFFGLSSLLLPALDRGTTVIVDELECSMHPLLAQKLVALFQSKEHNKKGAQLVFTTHNTELMDPELLRRDQIWFIEKNKDEASQLYSLHDFKRGRGSRSVSAFARNYLAGRYGAVPNFGPLFEELETE